MRGKVRNGRREKSGKKSLWAETRDERMCLLKLTGISSTEGFFYFWAGRNVRQPQGSCTTRVTNQNDQALVTLCSPHLIGVRQAYKAQKGKPKNHHLGEKSLHCVFCILHRILRQDRLSATVANTSHAFGAMCKSEFDCTSRQGGELKRYHNRHG